MKTFRSVLQEATKPKSRVLLFGRMNPITSGHEENVMGAHKLAQKHGADLHVIASHSHDPKKNPLTPEQKTMHLKRAFGHLDNTHVGTSSKEEPTILHQAAAAHRAGVKHLMIAGGGDRAEHYHKLLHDYNGVEGKSHGYYKFDKISIENTGERKQGVSGTDMRKHAAAGHFDKFRAGLPSKIAGNEKHAQEMYHHVRSGMGVHEDTRNSYVVGNRLRLGEQVIDSYTGMLGTIVYRGPTYVTVQIDETTSFKRWIDDVDSLTEHEEMTDASEFEIQPFKDFISTPADVIKYHLDRLHYCPGAQTAFKLLIGDLKYDQGTVQAAIDSTAHYLDIEEHATNDQHLDDHAISEFNRHFRQAGQLLASLGVLAEHREYMEKHAHAMMALAKKLGVANLGEAKDMDFQGHQDFGDEDLKSLEKHIDALEDRDIDMLYKETQKKMEDAEMDPIDEELDLDEDLDAVQRMRKKFNFIKTKSKREMAARVARKRMSGQGRLKKRAIVAARHMLMQRLLKGRNKATLGSAEKSRIEGIVHKNKAAIVRISNRLLPKLRDYEMRRLGAKHVKEDVTSAQSRLDHVVDHLSGIRPSTPTDPDPSMPVTGVVPKKTMARLKNFRKMET